MASQICAQMMSLTEEMGLLAAVLDQMIDGVIITNESDQVRLTNAAATHLLGTSGARSLGSSFNQAATHYPLIELWKSCLELG